MSLIQILLVNYTKKNAKMELGAEKSCGDESEDIFKYRRLQLAAKAKLAEKPRSARRQAKADDKGGNCA